MASVPIKLVSLEGFTPLRWEQLGNKTRRIPSKRTPETEEKAKRVNKMHNLRLFCNQERGVRIPSGPPAISFTFIELGNPA